MANLVSGLRRSCRTSSRYTKYSGRVRGGGDEVEVRVVFRSQVCTVWESEERENFVDLFVIKDLSAAELNLWANLKEMQ